MTEKIAVYGFGQRFEIGQQATEDEVRVDALVRCLGMDYKIHTCKPHENKTSCGMPIRRKKLEVGDNTQHYSCYACTY
jgi:hypothetical protein